MGDIVIAFVFEENSDSINLGEVIDRAQRVAKEVPGVRLKMTRGDAAETIKFFLENGELPVDEAISEFPQFGRFKKKAVEISAVQLCWRTWNEACDLLGESLGNGGGGYHISEEEVSDTCGEIGPHYIAINVTTTHGDTAVIRHGDWIIPDSKPGTFYPCKPDVFKATYIPVKETS